MAKSMVIGWRDRNCRRIAFHKTAIKDLCSPAKIDTRGTSRMNFGAVEVELDCKKYVL
jgi:hypothetical protein